MPPTIYLTDFSSDLARLQSILSGLIRGQGMLADFMSEADRQAPDARERMARKISAADACLGVMTFLRGWEPEWSGQHESMQEVELRLAQEAGLPIALFRPAEDSEMAAYLRLHALQQDEAHQQRQTAYWGSVAQAHLVPFTSVTDLTRRVTDMLQSWAVSLGAVPPADGLAQSLEAPPAERAAESDLRLTGLSAQDFAEKVAERTAEKVAAIQRQRETALAEDALQVRDAVMLQPGELVFGRPLEQPQFASDIFMVMPFRPEFDEIYTGIIRPLVKDMGLTIVRGDEFSSARGRIIDEVWSALNHCRFVIAEITGGNDNVFYELGIAHTLNKPAILITQAETPEMIPFDIRHLRYFRYENTAAGGARLREELRTTIARLQKELMG